MHGLFYPPRRRYEPPGHLHHNFGLTAKGTLINAAFLGSQEWRPICSSSKLAAGPTEHMYSIASDADYNRIL